MPRGRPKNNPDAPKQERKPRKPRGPKQEKILPPADLSRLTLMNSFRDGITDIRRKIGPDHPTVLQMPPGKTPRLRFLFLMEAVKDTSQLPATITNDKGETISVEYKTHSAQRTKSRFNGDADLAKKKREAALGLKEDDAPEADEPPESGTAETAAPAQKRRGRPPGSKNRKAAPAA